MKILQSTFALAVIFTFLSCTPNDSAQDSNPKIIQASTTSETIYVCPPCNSDCDELEFDKAGICPHCNMKLIKKGKMEKKENTKKKTIAFYLQPGVEILDFAGPMEVFAYAGFNVFTVSKTKDPIVSQGILKIIPDYGVDDAPPADILAFFGGSGVTASKEKKVIDWVKSQKDVEYYFSVCTGAFILAESGVLDGQTATTFHNALEKLEKDYPKIKVLKDVRFVDNGQVITTAGISAGIDGALHLVAKLKGFNEARRNAYYMEYDKWTPGEGLILTDQNPYKGYIDISNLEDYIGQYKFTKDREIEIKINERERSLFAILEGEKFPLFFKEKDQFTTIGNDLISFQRREDNLVKGYLTTQEDGKLFQKLNL